MRKPVAEADAHAPIDGRTYLIEPDGRIKVDPAKRGIRPFWLTTEPDAVSVPAAESDGAGNLFEGVSDLVPMPVDNKGPVEIKYSAFSARRLSDGAPVEDFTIAFYTPDGRFLFMNREIHAKTMAGGFGDPLGAGTSTALATAAGRPLVWPSTYFLEPREKSKSLFIGFRNLTTDDIEVRFVLAGVRYLHLEPFKKAYEEKQRLYGGGKTAVPYFFTTDTDINLATNGLGEFQMRVTDDADMELFKMAKESDGPFLWRIQEKTGERFLDNAPNDPTTGFAGVSGVHSDFGFGSGEFPFIPYESLFWPADFKAVLVVSNTLHGAQNRIWLNFISRRIIHARAWEQPF